MGCLGEFCFVTIGFPSWAVSAYAMPAFVSTPPSTRIAVLSGPVVVNVALLCGLRLTRRCHAAGRPGVEACEPVCIRSDIACGGAETLTAVNTAPPSDVHFCEHGDALSAELRVHVSSNGTLFAEPHAGVFVLVPAVGSCPRIGVPVSDSLICTRNRSALDDMVLGQTSRPGFVLTTSHQCFCFQNQITFFLDTLIQKIFL